MTLSERIKRFKIKRAVERILDTNKNQEVGSVQFEIIKAVELGIIEKEAKTAIRNWMPAIPHTEKDADWSASVAQEILIKKAKELYENNKNVVGNIRDILAEIEEKNTGTVDVELQEYIEYRKSIPEKIKEWNKNHEPKEKCAVAADMESSIKWHFDVDFIDVQTVHGLFCERIIDMRKFKKYEVFKRKGDNTTAYRVVRVTVKPHELPTVQAIAKVVDSLMYCNGWKDAFEYQMEFLS